MPERNRTPLRAIPYGCLGYTNIQGGSGRDVCDGSPCGEPEKDVTADYCIRAVHMADGEVGAAKAAGDELQWIRDNDGSVHAHQTITAKAILDSGANINVFKSRALPHMTNTRDRSMGPGPMMGPGPIDPWDPVL